MATIKIAADVDSAEFTVLKEKFDEYMVALAKAPAAWRGVGQELARTRTKFEAVAESATAVAATVAVMHDSGRKFYEVTTATARHWHSLAQSTASVAKNIVGATESLLKWTGIVGLVTGGAGLFGFDRLAHSVAGQRQAALGTGGDYGLRQAFLVNMRRFGDPEGMLNRVATAQTNIQSPESASLKRLVGLDLKGDPTEVAIRALEVGAKYASEDKGTPGLLGVDPRLEFFDQAERVRLRDKPGEVAEQIAKLRADQRSGKFNVSERDQKAYQDFITQVGKAGTEIETVFVKGLVKLAGPLEELSKATVGLVDRFLDKALPAFIKNLADGVEWLSTEMTKDTFTERVKGIVAMVGDLAASLGGLLSGLARFAKWIVPSADAATEAGGGGLSNAPLGAGRGGETSLAGGAPGHPGGVRNVPQGGGARGKDIVQQGGPHVRQAEGQASGAESPEVVRYIREAAVKRGVDPDVAVAAARSEGLKGFDPSKGTWSSGYNDAGSSFGPFQAHFAANIPGFRASGLGDQQLKDEGVDVRRMENWRKGVDYALDTAKRKHSWRDWHGMNRHAANEGLDYAPAQKVAEVASDQLPSPKEPKPDIGRGWQEALHKAQRSVSISSVPGGNTSLGSAAAASAGP